MLKFQRNFNENRLQLLESTGYDCGAAAKEIASYPIQKLLASELKLLAVCNALLEHYTFPASEDEEDNYEI